MMIAKAEAVQDYVVALRRDLHRNPELSGQEFKTRERLMKELDALGISYEKIATTSLVARINPGKGGRSVALRADIDALPIIEQSGVDFCSTNPGVMHACGHDAHAAMLMGAAKILVAMKDELPGEVRLIFQEAEETLSGARRVVAGGGIDGIETAFGLHGMSTLATGEYDLTPGFRMAGCDTIFVKFEGESGHAGAPHLARDTINPACVFTANLNSVVARDVDPLEPLVLSVGRFSGGTKANIVAKYTELDISMRYYDANVRTTAHEAIQRHAAAIAEAFRVKVTVKIEESAISLYNDDAMTAIAARAAEKVFGPGKNKGHARMMGSEDMPYYFQKARGAYALLGFRNEAKGSIYFPHNEKFLLDEDYFKYGVALHAQVAVDFLQSQTS